MIWPVSVFLTEKYHVPDNYVFVALNPKPHEMPDIRQSLKARREIRFLGAEKQKTGKLSLSYLVRRIFSSEKH